MTSVKYCRSENFRVRNIRVFNFCHVACAHALIIHYRKIFVCLIFAA